MILPFQKNYPLGCNLSCLFLGPWVNFSGTFILLLKQNQPALFFPPQTFMHSAQTVSATVQTWQVSMRAELLDELKTKYQLHSLPPQPLVKTKGRTNTFSAQEERGWGWKRGRNEDSCREVEDPALCKAGANGCSSLLILGFTLFLAASQISAFSPSLHALWHYPKMLLLRCPISTTTSSGYPMPLWMEGNTEKATCGSSATDCPQHSTFYICRG